MKFTKKAISVLLVALMVFSISAFSFENIITAKANTEETTEHVHSFGDWITVTEPTITKEGEKVRACLICDERETEAIPKLVETYNEEELKEEANALLEILKELLNAFLDFISKLLGIEIQPI